MSEVETQPIKVFGSMEEMMAAMPQPQGQQQETQTVTEPIEQQQQQQVVQETGSSDVQQPVATTEATQATEQQTTTVRQPALVQPPVNNDWYKALGIEAKDNDEAINAVKSILEKSKKYEGVENDLQLAALVKSGQYAQYEQINSLVGEDGTVKDPIELAKYRFATEQSARLGKTLTNAQVETMWNKHIEKNYGELDLSAGEPDFDTDPEGWTAYNDFLASEVGKSKEWAIAQKAEVEKVAKSSMPQNQQQMSAEQEQAYNEMAISYYNTVDAVAKEPIKFTLDAGLEVNIKLPEISDAVKQANPWSVIANQWGMNPDNGFMITPEKAATVARDVAILNHLPHVLAEVYRMGKSAQHEQDLQVGRNAGPANVVGSANQTPIGGGNLSTDKIVVRRADGSLYVPGE